MDQVPELAQPAADPRTDLAVFNHKTFEITFARARFPDRLPKGKGLARMNDQPDYEDDFHIASLFAEETYGSAHQ